ncbi:MAG: cytochrome c3 family protein [Nitrospirae bacterium]|nr:cytochrome c3 family protein [Nitrospirota bacterium]
MLTLSLLDQPSFANEKGCEECHNELYLKIYSYPFQHSDVVIKNCRECHIAMEGLGKWGAVLNDSKGHFRGELKTDRETGIDECVRKCHQPKQSHPVDVRVWGKRGYKVASDLPLSEGNIITCVTCHFPHGGNIVNLLRKNSVELCSSCHVM